MLNQKSKSKKLYNLSKLVLNQHSCSKNISFFKYECRLKFTVLLITFFIVFIGPHIVMKIISNIELLDF